MLSRKHMMSVTSWFLEEGNGDMHVMKLIIQVININQEIKSIICPSLFMLGDQLKYPSS